MKDRRELQRNMKGFLTLSKYLLRGSQHEKAGGSSERQNDGITPVASAQGTD